MTPASKTMVLILINVKLLNGNSCWHINNNCTFSKVCVTNVDARVDPCSLLRRLVYSGSRKIVLVLRNARMTLPS